MNEEVKNKTEKFKYNMSFYYQSTIIYFLVFWIYVIIRGEFVENSFKLITKDPIIYFFAIIVIISLVSLLYNIYKNKYLEITGDSLAFVNRFKARTFKFDQFARIKISKIKNEKKNKAFKLIRIKLKNRRRPIVLRPYDYENAGELINRIQIIKEKLENN